MSAMIIEYGSDSALLCGKLLKEGMVGIIPCDTIYGLCAMKCEESKERLFEIKNRMHTKSFITLLTEKQLLETDLVFDSDLLSLWPNPLTAVLASRSGGTDAVRIPSDPFLQAVLPVSGPIYSTSVHISGLPNMNYFDEILPVFGDKVDFIVRSSFEKPGIPSTLIDATKKPYQVIRQGSFRLDSI